jgi:phospholipase/carboxylesterase
MSLLEHEISRADTPVPAGVLLLLHGRGSNRHDLFGLRKRFPSDWVVIAPEAPFPAAPWGYGPGSAWYKFLGRNRPDPDSFARSLEALEEFIGALPTLIGSAPPRIALGGFSQGGTMSLGYALSHAGTIPDILNFSGFLADHPAVRATPANVQGTRFFWGHGMDDQNIPFALAVEGRAALNAAGADLEARDYAIGHWIDPQELEDAVAWLA